MPEIPNKINLNPDLTESKVNCILEQFEGLSISQVENILGKVDILLKRKFILLTPSPQNQELNP